MMLLLAVIYVSLPDTTPAREGVLNDAAPPASVANRARATTDTSADSRTPSVSPSVASAEAVQIEFDDHRIGPFAAAGWDGPAGDVEVAAYPTPFDRSIAVTASEGTPAETCLAVHGEADLLGVGVDLAVDDAANTLAVFTVRRETGLPLLAVALEATGASLTTDEADVVASGEGIDPDVWYTVRVEESADDVVVKVASASEQSTPLLTASVDGPLRVASVCLGVAGAADASAYYDNVRLEYERSPA